MECIIGKIFKILFWLAITKKRIRSKSFLKQTPKKSGQLLKLTQIVWHHNNVRINYLKNHAFVFEKNKTFRVYKDFKIIESRLF